MRISAHIPKVVTPPRTFVIEVNEAEATFLAALVYGKAFSDAVDYVRKKVDPQFRRQVPAFTKVFDAEFYASMCELGIDVGK